MAVKGSIAHTGTGSYRFPSDMKAQELWTSSRFQTHFQCVLHVKPEMPCVVFTLGRDRRDMSGMDFKIGPKSTWHIGFWDGFRSLLLSFPSGCCSEISYQTSSN